jgi:hypothetical protein
MNPHHAVPLLTLLVLSLSSIMPAQCSSPAQSGVRICAPTPNATVIYQPGLQINSTPVSGSIYKFKIYDNGREIFEGDPYQSGVTLFDADIRNGRHNIVVNAWDTGGNLVQSNVSFTVVGQGYPLFCAAPALPGINFCVPPASTVQSEGIPVSATATGYSAISAIQIYLDGKLQMTQTGYNYLSTGVFPTAPGQHSVTMVAYDTTGHRFAATKSVLSTYGYEDCPPKGNNPCSPGFVVNGPVPEAFVESSFTVDAQIVNNPMPITALKVYLDNTQLAASGGPTLRQAVSTGVSGTHILTFQAWDGAGHLYRVQQNVNVNVVH